MSDRAWRAAVTALAVMGLFLVSIAGLARALPRTTSPASVADEPPDSSPTLPA